MGEILYKDLSYQIIGAAMTVHRALGPGYLEAVYQKALAIELEQIGISFREQFPLPVTYRGINVGDYVADYIVEDLIVIEIKSVSKIHPRHQAQAMNYLAASGLKLAIIINFGQQSLSQKRVVR